MLDQKVYHVICKAENAGHPQRAHSFQGVVKVRVLR